MGQFAESVTYSMTCIREFQGPVKLYFIVKVNKKAIEKLLRADSQ
jgi:hypothetical protein